MFLGCAKNQLAEPLAIANKAERAAKSERSGVSQRGCRGPPAIQEKRARPAFAAAPLRRGTSTHAPLAIARSN